MAVVFKKLTESVKATRCPECQKEKYTDDHVCVSAGGLLYFFSLVGVDMPTYSYYHKTALKGGYVSTFDLVHHRWDHVHFPIVADEENLDDYIFANYDTVFMLIYSKFHGLKFHKLLVWYDSKWMEVPLAFDQKADIDEDVRCDVQFSVADGILYIAGSDSGNVKLSKMQITFDKHVVVCASITYLMSIDRLPIPEGAHITRLTVFENKIFAFWGCQGCGFRWQPYQPIVADLGTRKWSVLKITGEAHPPQGFGGPNFCFSSKHKWYLMGGFIQQGMTGHKECKEIWIFDLDKLQYYKTNTLIPDNLTAKNLTMAYDPTKHIVYAADSEHNVYEASLDDL